MWNYLAAIWQCRYFWLSLVKMDLRTRYRGSTLGMGWSLLHPIAMTAILCAAFHNLMGVPLREYAPSILAGLACWNYVLVSVSQGCQCFFQGEAYIRQYPAPLAIYPLRTALGESIHFVFSLLVATGLAWICNGFENVCYLITLLPSVLLLVVLVWSLAVLAGFANVYFQDTQHLTQIGFQILFYATPIIYLPRRLEESHMRWLLRCNPVVPFLDLIRKPIVDAQLPSLQTVALACAIVFVTTTAAGVTLARCQRRLIFQL